MDIFATRIIQRFDCEHGACNREKLKTQKLTKCPAPED